MNFNQLQQATNHEKCNFVDRFRGEFSSNLMKVSRVDVISGGRLPFLEERIQKFVDTREIESRQKCQNFDAISNKEMKQTCFDHNSAKSQRIAPRFGTLSVGKA